LRSRWRSHCFEDHAARWLVLVVRRLDLDAVHRAVGLQLDFRLRDRRHEQERQELQRAGVRRLEQLELGGSVVAVDRQRGQRLQQRAVLERAVVAVVLVVRGDRPGRQRLGRRFGLDREEAVVVLTGESRLCPQGRTAFAFLRLLLTSS
jgi:hypothetical protein